MTYSKNRENHTPVPVGLAHLSKIDMENTHRFGSNQKAHSLMGIQIVHGSIRGLGGISVEFKYPITAIAGRNGAGKTSLLGIAACAYHNSADGFNPLERQYPWYTAKDFLVQASTDAPVKDLKIVYEYLTDQTQKKTLEPVSGRPGRYRLQRVKKLHWPDNAVRIHRDVVFMGINRIVPRNELSIFRNSLRQFKPIERQTHDELVTSAVSRVLGRKYSGLQYHAHSGYKLPTVSCGSTKYSGLTWARESLRCLIYFRSFSRVLGLFCWFLMRLSLAFMKRRSII